MQSQMSNILQCEHIAGCKEKRKITKLGIKSVKVKKSTYTQPPFCDKSATTSWPLSVLFLSLSRSLTHTHTHTNTNTDTRRLTTKTLMSLSLMSQSACLFFFFHLNFIEVKCGSSVKLNQTESWIPFPLRFSLCVFGLFRLFILPGVVEGMCVSHVVGL